MRRIGVLDTPSVWSNKPRQQGPHTIENGIVEQATKEGQAPMRRSLADVLGNSSTREEEEPPTAAVAAPTPLPVF